jgi:hypothetical protein
LIACSYVNPDQQLFSAAKKQLQDFKDLFPTVMAAPSTGSKRTYWADIADTEVKLDSYVSDAKKRKTNTEEDFSMDVCVAATSNRATGGGLIDTKHARSICQPYPTDHCGRRHQ